ncbi:hypothetical protein GCK72_025042 [Caenorhabditis remanei]|uniref:Uncharacterized protein n=1 Tax=Caenorhabditis remanei TaxID=31234 RepID=A0A6A5G1N9_CAERE|nr:hypothetical protein GCK72_025042 [Caenorhabditis remanei]KAF1748575.1 hypothetical protein GCK72_025042 [Caenorhabditis remanei]
MNNSTVYFHNYYNRRSSSGKLELCMSPSSSSIGKSQSLEEIPDVNQRRRHPSLGFLEFSKTANFRSRRDAVTAFDPIEFQRVIVTVPTTPTVENTQKRKGDAPTDVDASKKLKHG